MIDPHSTDQTVFGSMRISELSPRPPDAWYFFTKKIQPIPKLIITLFQFNDMIVKGHHTATMSSCLTFTIIAIVLPRIPHHIHPIFNIPNSTHQLRLHTYMFHPYDWALRRRLSPCDHTFNQSRLEGYFS